MHPPKQNAFPVLYRCAFLSLLLLAASASPTIALDAYVSQGPGRLMLQGYDTTAYFLAGRPRPGTASHSVEWRGVTWRFSTPRSAAAFRATPTAYEPQFGAYCTGGLSQQHVVPADPRNWRLHGGKLYLFATEAGARRFDRDPKGTIRRAIAYWNTLPIRR
jgi:YHS domain-containing protein